jgi:hypothetical protein
LSRWSDVIYFDGPSTFTQNAMGDTIEVPGEPVMVYANKKSVRQSEYYQAQSNGVMPELTFEVRIIEYDGQRYLTYNNKRYRIIRTFEKGEDVELICEGAVHNAIT